MGTCMSKSISNQQKTESVQEVNISNPPAPHERRRRLSVSQSADVTATEERDRGHVQLSPNSVLSLFPQRSRRFSLAGAPACSAQNGFDDKARKLEGDRRLAAADFGVGHACKKGLKPESPNQDDFFILEVDEWGLYGVFDGHGPYGHDISNFVQQNLPKLVVTHPMFEQDPKKALRDAFVKMHDLIAKPGQPFEPLMSGTTGTVILHKRRLNKLYVAHVGDSRAVLAKRTPAGAKVFNDVEYRGVDLTDDHKPDLPAEAKRIHASGGEVKRMPHDIPHRVFVKGRQIPGLAMSRALGDTLGHSVGVSCEPEVREVDVCEGEDEFFLMCSDGVWEFIGSDEAVKLCAVDALIDADHSLPIDGPRAPQWDLARACDQLSMEAWNRWITEEHNVVDDITCILVKLYHKQNDGGASSAAVHINPQEMLMKNRGVHAQQQPAQMHTYPDNLPASLSDEEN